MWTELIFVGLFVLRCAVSSSPPKPAHVSFSSVNLRNVLHWVPGNGTPDGTHFTVRYAIYGNTTEDSNGKKKHWRAVHHCTKIARTWCDLSAETRDLEEWYFARVCALGRKSASNWTMSSRFDPKSDTIFGPPLLSVEVVNTSAIVTLQGPMRFSPNNQTPLESMKELYPNMSYNLSIFNTHRKQMHHFPVETSSFKYQQLDYNTEYCFFAKSRFLSMPIKCQSSAMYCLTTPQDPVIKQLQQAVVGIVVPSLCICIIVLVSYLLYNYLNGDGQKSPIFLQTFFHSSPLVLNPNNVTLQLPVTTIADDKSPQFTEISLIIPYPHKPYTNQEPEESMSDLSVSKDGGKNHTRPMKDENNLTGELQKCGGNCETIDVTSDDAHSSGGYKPQARRSGQSPVQTEASPSWQTCPQLQQNLVLPSEAWAPNQSNQRLVSGEQTVEIEEGEQNQKELENVPLLSGYASQRAPAEHNVHSQQSDCSSVEYTAVSSAKAQQTEAGHVSQEIEVGAKCCNPESIQLLAPWAEKTLGMQERLGGLQNVERETKDVIAEDLEEMYMTRSQPKLESVLIRQTSDEDAVAEIDEEVDHFFDKWGLVLSMNE